MSLAFPHATNPLFSTTLLLGVAASGAVFSAGAAGQSPPDPFASRVEAASDEGERNIAKFQKPKGFTVKLLAAEPNLANVVSFAIDYDGSVYAAETFRIHAGVEDIRSHMDWCDDDLAARTVEDRVAMQQKFKKEKFADDSRAEDRVRKLRDTNGDGTLDLATVFAGDFREPAAGIGSGVLSYKGSVYYTCIPSLWRLIDSDSDGVAERRDELSRGYGVHFAMVGHDLHGLRIGPDRRLYFSCGDRAFNVLTKNGQVDHSHSGGVLRCELDGSGLEVFASGLRNPQELVFDEWGNLFTGDNNSDGGDRARWVHLLERGDSGWRYGYQWLTDPIVRGPWNDEKLWHPHHDGQAAYLLPPLANLGAGPAGLTYDTGVGLPEAYRRHFFLCEFEGDPGWSGIFTFTVNPKGATFEPTTPERFVWGPLATDVDFAPDSSLFVSDWVAGWEKTGKGRIYRIAPDGLAEDPVAQRSAKLLRDGMTQRPVEELRSLLSEPDRRVRQEAHFELADRGAGGFEALLRTATDAGAPPLARVHGIWGLGIAARRHRAALPAAEMNALLSDSHEEVRAHAAAICGESLLRECSAKICTLVADASPRVSLFAAIALSKLGDPAAVAPLLARLRAVGESDPALRHGLSLALAHCASIEELAELTKDSSSDARIAAVVALRRRGSPEAARFLGDADGRVALEAARAIYDVPILPAFAALAARLVDPALAGNALVRRALGAALRLGGAENAERVAALAARTDAAEAHRAEAIRCLEQWAKPSSRDLVTGEWRPIVRTPEEILEIDRGLPAWIEPIQASLAKAPDGVTEAWIHCIRERKLESGAKHLLTLVPESARSARVRSAAVRALEALRPAGFEEAVASALVAPEVDLRVAALEVLLATAPASSLGACKTAMANGSIAELRAAYAGLAKLQNAQADALLSAELAKLDARLVPAEVALDLAAAAGSRGLPGDIEIPSRAATRRLDEKLAPFVDLLYGGDAGRGKSVFRSNAAVTCLRCHKIEEGDVGEVGPSLAGVGKRLSRLAILESVVDPNRKVSPAYQSTTFWLKDGTTADGRIVGEDSGTIRLLAADGKVREIPEAQVDERRAALSAMPENLAQLLKREELRDLVEYLASLR